MVRGNAGGVEESAAPAYDQKETRVYDYQGYDESGGAPAAEDLRRVTPTTPAASASSPPLRWSVISPTNFVSGSG